MRRGETSSSREGKCSEKGMRVGRDGKWGGEGRVLLGGKPGREGQCSEKGMTVGRYGKWGGEKIDLVELRRGEIRIRKWGGKRYKKRWYKIERDMKREKMRRVEIWIEHVNLFTTKWHKVLNTT